jgi:hypothetical protein
MPILRQCIEELIRETPADLLSRFDFTVFLYYQSFCIYLVNYGVVVQVLDYGIKMFKTIGTHFLTVLIRRVSFG